MTLIWKTLLNKNNYWIFICGLSFGAVPGTEFINIARDDQFSTLEPGPFAQQMNIHPGYHVSRHGAECLVEPYMSCKFTYQLSYYQFYADSPNPNLQLMGSLLEGARVWYYSVARGTHASFGHPLAEPSLHWALGFCQWFKEADVTLGFQILSSCLRWLLSRQGGLWGRA